MEVGLSLNHLARFVMLVNIIVLLFSACIALSKPGKNNVNSCEGNSTKNIADEAQEFIDNIFDTIESVALHAIKRFQALVITIARALYVGLACFGVLLWATGFNPGRGKQLIFAAIVLAILAEMASKYV